MAETSALKNLKPRCFAGGEWSKFDVECVGGLDAVYTHPVTGERRRDPCSLFDACGARTRAVEITEKRVRLPVVQEAPKPVSKWYTSSYVPSAQQRPTQLASGSGSSSNANNATTVTTSLFRPQENLPHTSGPFLSEPEHHEDGEEWWRVALRYTLRAALKGLALGFVHIVDTIPWRRRK